MPALAMDSLDLLRRALDVTEMYTGEDQSYAILTMSQKGTTRIIAATTSCISISASLLAVYWFVNMRRNFRRDLVLLLIIGEFFKNLWFLVFSTYSLSQGDLVTESGLCLANGYLLTVSIETCDLAILFMSLHMSLQIFPPRNSFLGHDGLYRIRGWVVAAWIVLPNVLAALAFINGRHAYEAAGPFCSLPIRPFWPRLALSWVPRYLIWLYIMWIAICIYRHVGKEFKVFGQVNDGSTSSEGTFSSPENSAATGTTTTTNSFKASETAEKDYGSVAPDVITPPDEIGDRSRHASTAANPPSFKLSVPDWSRSSHFGGTHSVCSPTSIQSSSAPGSRRGSQPIADGVTAEDFAPLSSYEFGRRRSSLPTLPREAVEPSTLDPISESRLSESSESSAEGTANEMIQSRRRAMQRQLRLLFIYPVVYIIIWIIPFVAHCLNYSDYYAKHPVFVLSALNIFCQTFLGTVDACIFCWRERPWRHIPGSDGTFLGSFKFWEFVHRDEWAENLRRQSRRPSQLGPLIEKKSRRSKRVKESWKRLSATLRPNEKQDLPVATPTETSQKSSKPPPVVSSRRPPMHKRTHTGGSDHHQLEVQRAHERLALERLDYEQRIRNNRRESLISMSAALEQRTPPPPIIREWWERPGMDQHLFEDNEEEERPSEERNDSNNDDHTKSTE